MGNADSAKAKERAAGRPAERDEFVMEVSAYGSPPGWWITVE